MRKLSLAQARAQRGAFIYGLYDGDTLFYIGQTIIPKERFNPESPAFQRGDHIMARIRSAGDNLKVVVIERMMAGYTPAMLLEAERQHIEAGCLELVNKHMNPIRNGFEKPISDQKCARCAEPVMVHNSRYCYVCLGSLLNKRGQSKQELRDLCKQINETAKMAALDR